MNTNRCVQYFGGPVDLGVLCNNLYSVFRVSNIWGPQYLIFSFFYEKQRMMCVQYLGGPVLAGRAAGHRTSPTRQRSAVDCYRVSEHLTKKLKVIIQISNRHLSWFCFIPIHSSQCNSVLPVLKFEMLFVRIPVQQDTSVLEGIVVRNKVGSAQLADRPCARAV